jgi:peptide-methionine (S)-S-oxide reductase
MSREIAIFGMGCFWGPQILFDGVSGVLKTEVGYMGGLEKKKSYSYEEVCSGGTGHAEVVKVDFNSSKVKYGELLKVFWENHDPTTMNRQGLDTGKQYRSVIFYSNAAQRKEAEASFGARQAGMGRSLLGGKKKIVTLIVKAGKFFKAEDYHQDYLKKRGQKTC